MSEPSTPADSERPGKVYVALSSDNEPAMTASLVTAQAVAQLTLGGVRGLWLENPELSSLARLPFARQILQNGRQREPLDPVGLEHYLQGRADRARATFERLSGSNALDFHRVRCVPTITAIFSTLETTGADATLAPAFLIHAPQGPTTAGRSVRRPSRAARTKGQPDRGLPACPHLAVLFDGSPSGRRALALALDLTRSVDQAHLFVVLGPECAPTEEAELQRAAGGAERLTSIRLGTLAPGRGALRRDLALPQIFRQGQNVAEVDALSRALQNVAVAAVIVPASFRAAQQPTLPELAQACGRPVVAVR